MAKVDEGRAGSRGARGLSAPRRAEGGQAERPGRADPPEVQPCREPEDGNQCEHVKHKDLYGAGRDGDEGREAQDGLAE